MLTISQGEMSVGPVTPAASPDISPEGGGGISQTGTLAEKTVLNRLLHGIVYVHLIYFQIAI